MGVLWYKSIDKGVLEWVIVNGYIWKEIVNIATHAESLSCNSIETNHGGQVLHNHWIPIRNERFRSQLRLCFRLLVSSSFHHIYRMMRNSKDTHKSTLIHSNATVSFWSLRAGASFLRILWSPRYWFNVGLYVSYSVFVNTLLITKRISPKPSLLSWRLDNFRLPLLRHGMWACRMDSFKKLCWCNVLWESCILHWVGLFSFKGVVI